MKPNRIVALLTPLVFAPLAGAVSSWLAQHFPGVNVSESDLQSIFIGGALIALAPAAQWLHGWQKYEAREADAAHAIQLGTLAAGPVAAPAAAAAQPDDMGDIDDLAELEDLDSVDDLDDLDDLGELDDELPAGDDELVETAG
jgi:hypothetical protein